MLFSQSSLKQSYLTLATTLVSLSNFHSSAPCNSIRLFDVCVSAELSLGCLSQSAPCEAPTDAGSSAHPVTLLRRGGTYKGFLSGVLKPHWLQVYKEQWVICFLLV